MEGGQDKIPQTPHLTHFRGNSVEGGTIIAPMEGGQEKIPQTSHLPHFRGNSVEGGTIIALPGMLSADFHGRWAR